MNLKIALITLVVLLVIGPGCSKTTRECGCLPPPTAVMGTWKLTAYLADPGDGSGTWTNVAAANSKTLIFEEDYGVGGDFSTDMKNYSMLSDSTLQISFTTGEIRTYQFALNTGKTTLELMGPCIEPCGSRFSRIK